LESMAERTLWTAAGSGQLSEVESIYMSNPDKLNVEDHLGWNPLHHAVDGNKLFNVQYLVKKGANVDHRCPRGRTALMHACDESSGYTRVVKTILQNGATAPDVDLKESVGGFSALTLSAAAGHEEIVDLLIQSRANLDVRTDGGWTALMLACARPTGSRVSIAIKLLEHGASVNLQNEEGNSALSLCADAGSAELTQALISKGANVNLQSNDGWTPLMCACGQDRGFFDIVGILLENGADTNLRTNDAFKAEDIAKFYGYSNICEHISFYQGDVAKTLESAGYKKYRAAFNSQGLHTMKECKKLTVDVLLEMGIDSPREQEEIKAAFAKGKSLGAKLVARMSFRKNS